NRAGEGIRVGSVKNLVGPEHTDQLILTYVGNIVSPTRHGFNNFRLGSRGIQLVELTRQHMPEAEACLPLDHQKLLGFRMMIMPASGYTRVSRKIGKLTGVGGFQHLDKHTALIAMLRH